WHAKHEANGGHRGTTPPPHLGAHPEPPPPECGGHAHADRIAAGNQDLVRLELAGDAIGARRGAAHQQDTRRHDGTLHGPGSQPPGNVRSCNVQLHCMTRRAPTHLGIQYAPSGSCGSSRESFTPVLELWMNLLSPTYIPTWVT